MSNWILVQNQDGYVDFDKEVLSTDDMGCTSLDVRLTFVLESRTAYMTVAWHNNDGNTVDLDGQRDIDWLVALRLLLGDNVELPEELQ